MGSVQSVRHCSCQRSADSSLDVEKEDLNRIGVIIFGARVVVVYIFEECQGKYTLVRNGSEV